MRKNDLDKEIWLTAAQCARRIGLTVRALRVYETAGLVRPRRTGKNWRLYGADEIARLNEVLTLKRLGLSLHQIAQLLAGRAADLDRLLDVQNQSLRDHLARIQRSLTLVGTLRAKVAAGDLLTVDDLLTLAEDTNMTDSSTETVAWRRYEQARPRTERAIDPALHADFCGFYALDTLAFVITSRDGRLFSRLTGQPELEIFPEDVDRFFYKAVQAQISFTRDESGAVSGLTLHQNGYDQVAPRVDESVATALEASLAERIRRQRPVDNGRALLMGIIDQHQRGEVDYERMAPPLADVAREQSAAIQAEMKRLGPLKDLSFKGVTDQGWDVYAARFENGDLEWSFALAADGRVGGMLVRPSL